MRMGRRAFAAAAVPLMAAAMGIGAAALTGCGSGGDQAVPIPFSFVEGGRQVVGGGAVTTWANVRQDGVVQEVGATVPLSVIQNPPSAPLPGRMTTILVSFPQEVQARTVLNHFTFDLVPQGHPPAPRYTVPHFDAHFYSMTPQQVAAIKGPDPVRPPADRVPPGYQYPPANEVPFQTVPEMGVHLLHGGEFAPGAPPFSSTMVVGFFGGSMNFLEPMMTREFLLRRQSFELPVPQPQALGRATQYPTRFVGQYDPATDSYHFVFSNFVSFSR